MHDNAATSFTRKNFQFYLLIIALFLLIIGTGCNSSDESTPPPSKPSETTYSGNVSAPGSSIAQFKNKSLSQHLLTMLFGSEIQAAITGMTGVADASVELIQIDDEGNQVGDVIASTMTNGSGEYSLTTTASPASDLVLRVASSSATIRAFASSESVDISTVSEYLIQKILAEVAGDPSVTLENFNNTELGLLMDFLDSLSVFLAPATVADSLTILDSAATAADLATEIGLYSPDGLMLAGIGKSLRFNSVKCI